MAYDGARTVYDLDLMPHTNILGNKNAPLEMIPPHYVKRNMYKSRHSILYQKEIFDRYQNVRHLTGSMGFWFIFQTPDTLPDIEKIPSFPYIFFFFACYCVLSTPYCYLNILNSSAECSVGWNNSAITRPFRKNSIKLTKHKILIIPKEGFESIRIFFHNWYQIVSITFIDICVLLTIFFLYSR